MVFVGLTACGYRSLAGWQQHDHAVALEVFRRSCVKICSERVEWQRFPIFGGNPCDWKDVCAALLTAQDARRFFETHFLPFQVHDPVLPAGLFTGYFEPEVNGSLTKTDDFRVPIYSPPHDLVSFTQAECVQTGLSFGLRQKGQPKAYLTRREIELGALVGQGLEIAWVRDWVDAFFIHVQGSGRVRLMDGSSLRLTFAAKSGRPYTSIGQLLVQSGQIDEEQISMQAIRSWMTDHPDQARRLMWENESFIFFRSADLENSALGALGAQHVQLTPRRSLAVDRSYWAYGTPIWLDTKAPIGCKNSLQEFKQLLVAQDTGSAIRGMARGDVYWGFGDSAGHIAGSMKSTGRMVVLLPHAVARRVGLAS